MDHQCDRQTDERTYKRTDLRQTADGQIDGQNYDSFRKIFNVSSNEIVYWCRYMFNCVDVEDTLSVRKRKFLQKYCLLDNTVCALCRQQADIELASLN